MPAEGAVAIMVLAAGASTRMGRPKLLLPLDGEPLALRAARRALASGASQIVVVIGRGDCAVRSALDGLTLDIVETPTAGAPISASIHTGLDVLRPDVSSVVIALADMVHVTAAMLGAVVSAAGQTHAPPVVSRYGDVTAPPLAFPRRLFPELHAATGDGIGKAVMTRHRAEAETVDWPPDAIRDVDTPADYREVMEA